MAVEDKEWSFDIMEFVFALMLGFAVLVLELEDRLGLLDMVLLVLVLSYMEGMEGRVVEAMYVVCGIDAV